ncbi:DNA-binding transcriptional LysR family regulator (plasmid) [Ensifer sp. WSM1721]|uniref:LysR family transcriptional regulator n=1 Tax=Ensifer sp. WSM1721 TaxID=1041159 RepID=UPI00047DD155|nr:LysR family transcriptional regulator [Ensifer sp. WSM1721]
MRINQRQMEIFNAIMVYKSVTAAAASLRTSQPTVSRELRDLERQIGFDLFNRFGKRLTPTNQAQLLHSVVARSFVGMEEISRVAIAIRGYDGAYLRIACIPAYAEALMPVVARRFLDNRPRVLLSVHSLEEVPLRHDLTTKMFDVGLTEGSYEHDETTTEKIDVGELLCVLPAGHRLAVKNVIQPRDFEGVEFVYFSQEDPYRRKLDDIFDAEGISRRFSVETTTATGVCSMVAAGVGVSIVNPFTAAHYCKKGVVLRKLSVRVPYEVALWRPAEGLRSTHADLFVKVLHEVTAIVKQQLKAQLGE